MRRAKTVKERVHLIKMSYGQLTSTDEETAQALVDFFIVMFLFVIILNTSLAYTKLQHMQ